MNLSKKVICGAKARLILLVYYLYRQEIKNRLDYKIDYVQLFSPPEEDMKIIEHDFNVIKDKICAGKAHELSEGDTLYLGAATKAATSEDRRELGHLRMSWQNQEHLLSKIHI